MTRSRPSLALRSLSAALVALAAGVVACPSPPERGSGPLSAPSPDEQEARHPDPEGALASCAAALERVASAPPDVAYPLVAEGCAELFAQPGCRDAVRQSVEVDPAARASTLSRRCAEAYCPLLPSPRPALCSPAARGLGPGELGAAWRELVAAARRLDFGDQGDAVAAVDPFVGEPTSVEVARAAAPVTPPEVVLLRLAVVRGTPGLRLSGACPAGPASTWELPEGATAEGLDAPLASLPCLSEQATVTIAADDETPYAAVVALLDAVRRRGVERFSVQTGPAAPPAVDPSPPVAVEAAALAISAHAAMRTSGRPPYVRLLVHNPTARAREIRVVSIASQGAGGARSAVVARVEVYDAERFTKTGGRVPHGKVGAGRPIRIPPSTKRDLEVYVDGIEVPYRPSTTHRFTVVVEEPGHPATSVDATLDDAIRHPIRH